MSQASLETYAQAQTILATQRQVLLDALRKVGACTTYELMQNVDVKISQPRARMHELKRANKVKYLGKRKCLITHFTNSVWEALP